MADPISAAIAAFSAAATSTLVTVGAVAASLAPVAALGPVFSAIATTAVTSAVTGAAMSALSPKPKVSAANSQLQTKVGAVTPRTIIFGRTAVAGTLLTPTPLKSGKDDRFATNFYALSHSGPSGVVESIQWGDDTVTFDVNGNAIGKYNDNMWLFQKNGSWSQTAINFVGHSVLGSSTPAAWDSTKRAQGCLTVALVVRYAAKVLGGNMQTPLFVVDANAISLIDPRTGSAATTQAQRRNPAVCAYSWRLGWFQNNKRVIGLGQPASEIHAAAYAYAANVADANSWTVAGEASTADDRYAVELAILQACASVPVERNGLQSVVTAALRSSVGTITSDDLRANPKWRYQVEQSSRPTAIQTRYRSEANRWQMVEGAEVTDAAWLTEDAGREKRIAIEYAYAANGSAQVGHLAALDAVNAREPIIFYLPCKQKARYAGFVGDAITIQIPEIGLSSLKVTILSRVVNSEGTVDYEVLTETDAKYPFAASKTSAAPSFTLNPGFDIFSVPQPGASEWASVAAQITSGGTSLPIVRVTGSAADYSFCSGVIFKLRLNSVGSPWLVSEDAPPEVAQHEFRGLTNSTGYIVGIAYRGVTGVEGPVRELAAVTTGSLLTPVGPNPSNMVPGSGPLIVPGNNTIGWLGEVGERWEIVESNQAYLGLAMWKYDLGGRSWDELLSPIITVSAGDVLSAGGYCGRFGTWTSGDIGYAILFLDASGDVIGAPEVIGWALDGSSLGGGAYEIVRNNFVAPAGTVAARFSIGVANGFGTGYAAAWRFKMNRGATFAAWSDEATTAWMWQARIGLNVTLPDNTVPTERELLNNFSPRIEGPKTTTFQASFTGDILSGEVPRLLNVKRYIGNEDVSATTTWSLTSVGCTASVSAGIVTVTAVTVGGSISVTSVRDGLTMVHEIEVLKNLAAPPVTGGGGATIASDTTIDPTASTSLVTCGGPITVRAGAAGTINFSAYLSFTTDATVGLTNAAGRVRYRIGAGAWSFAGPESTTIVPARGFPEPEIGEIDCGIALTGLVNGTDYECELQMRRSSGAGTLSFIGSFAAEAS